jgi:hypothetical protein
MLQTFILESTGEVEGFVELRAWNLVEADGEPMGEAKVVLMTMMGECIPILEEKLGGKIDGTTDIAVVQGKSRKILIPGPTYIEGLGCAICPEELRILCPLEDPKLYPVK